MIEAFKSVVFVAVAVMVALVLQAQAASLSTDDLSDADTTSALTQPFYSAQS